MNATLKKPPPNRELNLLAAAVELEAAGPEGMDVAGQDHGVVDALALADIAGATTLANVARRTVLAMIERSPALPTVHAALRRPAENARKLRNRRWPCSVSSSYL